MSSITEEKLIQTYKVFFNNYVEAGSQWMSIFSIRQMNPHTVEGKIVLWVRDWLNYLDGIALLYSCGNTYAAKTLLRSCWEIYIQFKFFLSARDEHIIYNKILCIELVEMYRSITLQDKYYQKLVEQGNQEDAEFLKGYSARYQEIYQKNKFLNKEQGEVYKKLYHQGLRKKWIYKWYGLYLAAQDGSRINSINALSRSLYTHQGKSLGELNELIYGMLSAQAHGGYSRNGYYRQGEEYYLLPLRNLRGAGLVAMCVQIMFEDIWDTLENYFQGKVEVKNKALEELLMEQREYLGIINFWDKELTCGKIKKCT